MTDSTESLRTSIDPELDDEQRPPKPLPKDPDTFELFPDDATEKPEC